MIKEILNATFIYDQKRHQPFTLDLKLGAEYIIKCDNLSGTQYLHEIDIYNLPFPEKNADIQEDIFRSKFIGTVCKRFKVQGIQPFEGNLCLAYFLLWLDQEEINFAEVFSVKMLEIDSEHLKKLKLDNEKIEQIINIIEKFFSGYEIDAIREICVLSEFITQKLIEKIEKRRVYMDFGSMVNKLCNIGKKQGKLTNTEQKKYKYNYKYLGSMLYPIYFLRNEILHGKIGPEDIKINKNHAQIILYLFIEILNYLAVKQLSLLY